MAVKQDKNLPTISRAEYARRRRELMDLMGDNSIAILPSAKEVVRSRDTHFSFRQDSDFHYLTGFPEPDSVLVLLPGREHGEYVMFCREKDVKMETWHGRRAGFTGVKKRYGCNDAFPVGDIDEILPGLMEGRERIYYEFGNHAEFDTHIMNWINALRAQVKKGAHPPGELIDLSHILHDMRLIKSPAEIKVMEKAAQISAKAHVAAMHRCRPGLNELQIEAELKYQFANQGARFEAYNSIVAGGENACVLHYVENDCELKNGDLLLIDAGAEYLGYASDISRTFPVNGKFTPAQKQAYEWVLKANQAAIRAALPGEPWSAPHDAAVKVLTKGLVEMGILNGELETLIETKAYLPYFMHKTGHWIGLDVHDVGDYLQDNDPRELAEGMVLTVEPGLYFPQKMRGLDKKWWGIGIRIEDDIVITKNANKVLTKDVPKTVAAIEALMQQPGKRKENKAREIHDVVIAGGGMAGATAAIGLAQLGLSIALVEAVEPTHQQSTSFDRRSVALSAASVRILQSLHIWPEIASLAFPIKKIHISDQGHMGFCRLDAEDYHISALGQVLPLEAAGPALWQIMRQYPNIDRFCPWKVTDTNVKADLREVNLLKVTASLDHITPEKEQTTLKTQLLLAADGSYSNVAKSLGLLSEVRDYSQSAVIANIETDVKNNQRAFERFTEFGPLALLPISPTQMNLVWCHSIEAAHEVMKWDDATFISQLQAAFGYRLGQIIKASKRFQYPLSLRHCAKPIAPRAILLGNSAHTLHPIAGQGFNLGLRDIAELFELIVQTSRTDIPIGSDTFLSDYCKRRRMDWQQTILATDSLVRLFSNEFPPYVVARNKGLFGLNRLPWLKRQFAQAAMGFTGTNSRLACGISLPKQEQ